MVQTLTSAETGKPMLCTVPEVARSLAISRSKVYSLMDSGRLPHVKLGRSRRLRWEDVMKLIDENTVGGDGACS
jgi:excisionase family DNA binding protein